MSVRMMTLVFDRYPNGEAEMVLALALADHADDLGENIFPSIPRLAVKTRQSDRSVQRQIRKMEEWGWLLCVRRSKGGPGNTSEYRINPLWIAGDSLVKSTQSTCDVIHNGDNLSPLVSVDNSGLTVTPEVITVTPVTLNGDIAVSPESSLTIKNHHLSAREQSGDVLSEVVEVLQRAGVQVSSGNAALVDLVAQGLTVREAAECASIARQKKPNDPIPWAYLVKVIQTQREQGLVCKPANPPDQSHPWWLDADKIAAKAYELHLVHGTVTDRKLKTSEDFQMRVLNAAGVDADVWAQWRAWREKAA